MKPLVSVVLPVFNGSKFIGRAIESILSQSEPSTEILIYDDGSTDGSAELLRGYKDARIRLLVSPTNLGYVHWLNCGLQEAAGAFIARMDADDVAHPDRLASQLAAFKADPELVLVGTNTKLINDDGKVLRYKSYPECDVAIRWDLLFDNPFCHPTVMMRADVVRQHGLRYNASLMPTEDYRFWVEILRYGRGINLQQPLLDYRVHGGQVSQTKRQQQLDHHDAVVREALNDWPECQLSQPLRLTLRKLWQGDLIQDLPDSVRVADVANGIRCLLQSFRRRFDDRTVNQEVLPRLVSMWDRLISKSPTLSDKLALRWHGRHWE